MPKVSDIVELKRVLEDKFKQLYSDPFPKITIQHAENSYNSWLVIATRKINNETQRYLLRIDAETGDVLYFKES